MSMRVGGSKVSEAFLAAEPVDEPADHPAEARLTHVCILPFAV